MKQSPAPGDALLFWTGDLLEISLETESDSPGHAVFRTNIGRAAIHRQEVIQHTENGDPILARDWHDVPMQEVSPGRFSIRLPLTEVGIFSGKACFFPNGSSHPLWPDGPNLQIKVEPAHTASGNTMYTAFVRQFGPWIREKRPDPARHVQESALDHAGYTVIPPSGTFRDVISHLDTIMGSMHFRILQLLPVHPVPTTFARMGRFGSAFAALDFLSVDPALAVFDTHATPLDQFRELIDAVHARGGTLYMDLPANHTGWAATLQTHHPEWYHRRADGEFVSPGAWGVTWADLVELDYTDPELRAYMAEVFLFWCEQGVDGFRCDAGYMIPAETWTYITARVRSVYPDTIFLLEGLGGKLETTDHLLSISNLDWAYSELFQTIDRPAFDWYLPQAIARSERFGPLIHFAETHDNNRLAASGPTYAKMRVTLSALLSHCGAFGIANGVEWFAKEKIDVHGASPLNWDASGNLLATLLRLNTLLLQHPLFGPHVHLRPIHHCDTPTLAVLREAESQSCLVLANLDCEHEQTVYWPAEEFTPYSAIDLLTGKSFTPNGSYTLHPGEVLCFAPQSCTTFQWEEDTDIIERRQRNLMAMRVREWIAPDKIYNEQIEVDALGDALAKDPATFCKTVNQNHFAPYVQWNWPQDLKRVVPIPHGFLLFLTAPHPFLAKLSDHHQILMQEHAIHLKDGSWGLFLPPGTPGRKQLTLIVFAPEGIHRDDASVLFLPEATNLTLHSSLSGQTVRADFHACTTPAREGHTPRNAFSPLHTVLSNQNGAMSYVRAAWGEIRSQYDCLLGLNLDPNVPADKTIFWSRCRIWLRSRGYSHEVNQSCMTRFSADPAGRFAEWEFHIPCGTGNWIPLSLRLDAANHENRVRLSFHRKDHPGALDREDKVTLILRPDLEWRSFHTSTKAFTGPEKSFPAAIKPFDKKCIFSPPGAPADVGLALSNGAFHLEPEWSYMIPHPEESERGLEGSGDLFSPGWFEVPLYGDEKATLIAGIHPDAPFQPLTHEPPRETIPFHQALSEGLSLFVVKRDAFKTVIAGYPWFLDWGRDTLIVLRGLIADGKTDDALAILREFGRFEENGTLPNIIHGDTVGNRDTSDAPLWFCIATGDLIQKRGDDSILNAQCGNRSLRTVIHSILQNIQIGTPNGVKMDQESALVFSPSHFTWMDTNYPAGTPREGYPVEIQALWIASLRLASVWIDPAYGEIADRATASLQKFYPLPNGGLVDCLRAKPGTPASQAEKEDTIRPNQLYAITLGAIRDPDLSESILRTCEQLLIPGAIRSLADQPVQTNMGIWRDGILLNAPYAPYKGDYRGDEDTRRKPAYHNGTAWSLPFPLYAEAFVLRYGECAREPAASLLASAIPPMEEGGALTHIAEIFDGNAPHLARGCSAQAWGLSELLRVWKWINDR